ncbi:hypothetical protein ACIOEX_01205 [Streptomyces sp. NPDC087850]|uniref:hypothetical protein n=1 Tax=Streptomyces sp. NPDC087850 TaxID=3365809 RepID=UPI003825B198
MSPIEIAEARARQSDDPQMFMLAYSAGWNAAADGADLDACARRFGDDMAAGFIEGVTAFRARTATAADYMPHSRARNAHLRGNR